MSSSGEKPGTSTDLSTDLALVFDAAGDSLEGLTAEAFSRFDTAGEGDVILADRSYSMADPAGFRANMTRFQALCIAIEPFRKSIRPPRVIAFDGETLEVDPLQEMPKPRGGTDVAGAIRHAATLMPARTVLVCDGESDHELAYKAVATLPGILDVIFVGNDMDIRAKTFMQELARRGGGTYRDLSSSGSAGELGEALTELLLPPHV